MNTAAPRPPRHRAAPAGVVRLAAVASTAALALLAAPAGAAPAGDRAAGVCPASLRAVPGGTSDPGNAGRDDGAPGGAAAYEPGEILVQLRADTPRAAFRCLRRELGAALADGGPGRQGFGGIPGLMLIQLPGGRSVSNTVRLLRSPRYRDLIAVAQPNGIIEGAADAAVNDPLFPFQWGLQNGNAVSGWKDAADKAARGTAITTDSAFADEGLTGPAASMRLRQAWQKTKTWFRKPPVKVAIIDDSLTPHGDLQDDNTRASNVSSDGSRVIEASAFRHQVFSVTVPQGGEYQLVTGGGDRTCSIAADAPAATMQHILARRVMALCNQPQQSGFPVTPYMIEVNGATGSLVLNDGTEQVSVDVARLQGGTPAEGASVLMDALTGRGGAGTGTARFRALDLPGDRSLIDVQPMQPHPDCTGPCRRFVIALAEPGGVPPLGLPPGDIHVLKADGTAGSATAKLLGVVVVNLGNRRFMTTLAGTGEPKASIQAVPASAIADVEGLDGYVAKNPGSQWPGTLTNAAGERTSHGQKVAGVIGALSNNTRGLSGVVGPHVRLAMSGIVTPSNEAALVAAIEYAGKPVAQQGLGAKVVNMSLGTQHRAGDQAVDYGTNLGVPDPRPMSLTQLAIARQRDTLFVISAGNVATDLRRPAARLQRDGEATKGLCAPKGMAITTYPGNLTADERTAGTARGGDLSERPMPDDTYDRGNIICVASMSPVRAPALGRGNRLMLSDFSGWGRGIVDVAAPGERVVTTGLDNTYAMVDGTSFSAPMVAGVAAMIYHLNPRMAPSLVKCAILSSATSAPLDQPVAGDEPYAPYADGFSPPLTVNGMVVASEALSAAASLKGSRGAPRYIAGFAGMPGTWVPPTRTCVQRREKRRWDAAEQRLRVSGSWVNTDTAWLGNLKAGDPAAP